MITTTNENSYLWNLILVSKYTPSILRGDYTDKVQARKTKDVFEHRPLHNYTVYAIKFSDASVVDIVGTAKISDKDGGTIVGATIEEMKRADPNAKSIGQMAKEEFKDKKQLNMQDMLKLHGYKV